MNVLLETVTCSWRRIIFFFRLLQFSKFLMGLVSTVLGLNKNTHYRKVLRFSVDLLTFDSLMNSKHKPITSTLKSKGEWWIGMTRGEEIEDNAGLKSIALGKNFFHMILLLVMIMKHFYSWQLLLKIQA